MFESLLARFCAARRRASDRPPESGSVRATNRWLADGVRLVAKVGGRSSIGVDARQRDGEETPALVFARRFGPLDLMVPRDVELLDWQALRSKQYMVDRREMLGLWLMIDQPSQVKTAGDDRQLLAVTRYFPGCDLHQLDSRAGGISKRARLALFALAARALCAIPATRYACRYVTPEKLRLGCGGPPQARPPRGPLLFVRAIPPLQELSMVRTERPPEAGVARERLALAACCLLDAPEQAGVLSLVAGAYGEERLAVGRDAVMDHCVDPDAVGGFLTQGTAGLEDLTKTAAAVEQDELVQLWTAANEASHRVSRELFAAADAGASGSR